VTVTVTAAMNILTTTDLMWLQSPYKLHYHSLCP